MSYFAENLELLKTKSQVLYNKIFEEDSMGVNLYEDELGFKVQRGQVSVYLRSIYDVEREQREIFKTLSKDATQVVVFGLGCGDSLRYLQANFPNLYRIVLVEPSIVLYKKFLEEFSIEKELNLTNITMIINENPESIAARLADIFSKVNGTSIFSSLSYRTLFKDIFSDINKHLLTKMRFLISDTQMIRSHAYLWAYDSLKNLKYPAVPIEEYFECFKGKAVIIVGAGPSLTSQLEQLKEAADKAIIVAVGSGIRVLAKCGIIPHFRMAFDGGCLEMHVFDGVDTAEAPLIFSNRLYFEVLEMYKGPIIRMIIDQDTISRYLMEGMELPYHPIRSGPSITVVALDLFSKVGASEIILLGQDLSFATNGLSYAEGGRLVDNSIDFEDERFYKVENSDGQVVYTDIGFLSVRDSLEMLMKLYPEINVYNGTPRGLEIPGAKPIEFQKWLQSKASMGEIVWPKDCLTEDEERLYEQKYFNELKNMGAEISKIELITERRIKMIKRFMKLRQREVKAKKLDEIVVEIDKFEAELSRVKLYKMDIEPILKMLNNAIVFKNYYEGPDLEKRYESREKILLGIAAQLEEYLIHLKNVLWEIESEALTTTHVDEVNKSES